MRTLVKLAIAVLILGGGGALAYPYARGYWDQRNKPEFRQVKVAKGEIVSVVNSTGTVQPVLRVQVGSFVSGPVVELLVDFNKKVKTGDLLARIDDRIYLASMTRDEAALATRNAEVARVEALLEQARNDEERARDLFAENPDYISEAEMDQVRSNRKSLEAQLEVAKASVKQAQANLENSETNVGYTKICSPVDGMVIERSIDPGQMLASQFQAPQLFVIAPEMEEHMHIYASVDEADIGKINDAKVEFTIDAYPDDLFVGKIYQVRINPINTQGVVTYPVVVEAPNPQMKLLPGMTANLSFQIERREDLIKIPNAALRFYPEENLVREEDRKLLDGAAVEDDRDEPDANVELSATQKIEANRDRNRRHVWVLEGDLLKAIEVVVGLSDNKFTELVEGPLKEGQELVSDVRPRGSQ
jgi:HlyD family secretion protein